MSKYISWIIPLCEIFRDFVKFYIVYSIGAIVLLGGVAIWYIKTHPEVDDKDEDE